METPGCRGLFLGRFAAGISAFACLLAPGAFSPAHAGAIALSFTGGGLFQRGSFENFGWSFDVTQRPRSPLLDSSTLV